MKSLFALLALATTVGVGCAGAESTESTIDEAEADLSARAGCSGKSEGDSCSLCGTKPGCVETMVVKTCQKRGTRLYCRSGASQQQPQPPAYDPCGGKRFGDSCSLCAPNTDCVETMVEKTCGLENGKLACNSGAPTYNPCAGKQTGDSCTLCDPNDKQCGEIMVVKTCKANGVCSPGQ